jgi:4-amino-4-deoxy-L-arabinose transferase-like glycosyltransferase
MLNVPLTQTQALERTRLPAGLALVAGLSVLVVLSLLLLQPRAQPLTSDESLYLAQGLSLAEGHGYTYTTGEPAHHRGPVFPALLALDLTIGGKTLENAYWLPRALAFGAAMLTLLLGWRLYGREAGMLGCGLVLASSLLGLLANTLFLDGAQSFFVLATLCCVHVAIRRSDWRWAAAAGAALGIAFLTKESALQLLPLPFLLVALQGRAVDRPGRLLLAYSGAFAATAGWWWVYVYTVTGTVYLLGEPSHSALWVTAGLALVVVAAGVALLASRTFDGRSLRQGARWGLVGLATAIWGGFFIVGLEAHSGWDFASDYFRTVPDYTTSVLASWLRPLPLIALSWGYVGYRAIRGSLSDRVLLLALLLLLPFALFVANRSLHVRDVLPLVYLSYVALARSGVDFARWAADALKRAANPLLGPALAAALLVLAFGWFVVAEQQRLVAAVDAFEPNAVQEDNWGNPLAQQTASWIETNVAPGMPIMSSRLYYSHVFFLTGARYPTWQVPTVRVDFRNNPHALARTNTMFRWEDHLMPAGPAEPWLYLRRYPTKGYYIALSERDFLDGLREHSIGYLVLSGNDGGFSSLSLLPYAEAQAGFALEQSFEADANNQVHIFRVDAEALRPVALPAAVSQGTLDALQAQLGPEARALLEGMNPAGYEIR